MADQISTDTAMMVLRRRRSASRAIGTPRIE